MSKRRTIAQALVAGLFMSVVSVGVGLGPSAEAQTRCEPYDPHTNGINALVNVPNYCSISNESTGRLQRYRGALVGWRTVDTVKVPAGKVSTAKWQCDGVGTYTYRGTNTVNTYLFIGDERRFSC